MSHSDIINNIHPREMLRCEVGSTLHGIGIGSDDTDLMGIMLEPENALFGLDGFEQIVQRTAKEGERSGSDDIDITVFGLKKWMKLATQGNPSVIVLLYAPESYYRHLTDTGRELIVMRDAIVSQYCINRFLGYMNSQRQRALKGKETGHGNRESRQQKWASHMVRLGYQGLELAGRGSLTLPMPTDAAETCKAIKRSEISFADALQLAQQLENQIEHLKDRGKLVLPEKPNYKVIQTWMKKTYLQAVEESD